MREGSIVFNTCLPCLTAGKPTGRGFKRLNVEYSITNQQSQTIKCRRTEGCLHPDQFDIRIASGHQTMNPRVAATANHKFSFYRLRSRRAGDKVQEVQYVSKVAKVDLS
jgi:hypothetical protein